MKTIIKKIFGETSFESKERYNFTFRCKITGILEFLGK
jgi:hypothetical protein